MIMNQITKTIGLYEQNKDCCEKWTEAIEALVPILTEKQEGPMLERTAHKVRFCPWCGAEK